MDDGSYDYEEQSTQNEITATSSIFDVAMHGFEKHFENAIVKNSLISDGCVIEGVVENSILFRGVKVEKGAVVKNSVIMQDNIIGANTSLDCVITDKNVVVSDKKTLSGCSSLPYFIQKGTRL